MLDLKRRRGEAPAPRPFQWDEALAIVGGCRGRLYSPRDHMLLSLMLFTGARCCEVVTLQRDDLDTEQGRITLRHTKGRQARAVYVPSLVMPQLLRYLRWLDAMFPRTTCLFPASDGQAMTPRVARGLPRKYGHAISMHRLRHTYATEMLKRSGGNLRLVQTLLGHRSPATTARYLAVYDSEKRAAAELLTEDATSH